LKARDQTVTANIKKSAGKNKQTEKTKISLAMAKKTLYNNDATQGFSFCR